MSNAKKELEVVTLLGFSSYPTFIHLLNVSVHPMSEAL
jgi:hypothetical protein